MPALLAPIRYNAIGKFCSKLIDRSFLNYSNPKLMESLATKKNVKLIYARFRFVLIRLSTSDRSRNANHEEIRSRDKSRKVEEYIA